MKRAMTKNVIVSQLIQIIYKIDIHTRWMYRFTFKGHSKSLLTLKKIGETYYLNRYENYFNFKLILYTF